MGDVLAEIANHDHADIAVSVGRLSDRTSTREQSSPLLCGEVAAGVQGANLIGSVRWVQGQRKTSIRRTV